MFGYPMEELPNLTVDTLLPKHLELQGRRRDGIEFPISVGLSHIPTDNAMLAIYVITDLTERKQAEEALQLSQEQLALAQQAAGVGVWDWDVRSGRVRCSREWGPLYGLPPGTQVLAPEECLSLVHPDDQERIRKERSTSLENGKPYSTEFRVVWPDGSIRWLLGEGRLLRLSDGQPMRVLGVNMDITDRKRAEQERLAFSDRVANAQEEERRRIYRELHDNLTQHLAAMAMDLGVLAAGSPTRSSELQKRFRALQSGVVQAAEVARHLAYELHSSELDDLGLAAALRSYCEDFERREKISIEFTKRNLPEAWKREVACCLYKVTQEGLRNVAKHANARRGSVNLDATGARIRLRVCDTGVGFSVPSLGAASGLGILIMKERVRLINGSFAIRSKPGQGTQITVEVPLS